ncbi:hypothetical protein K4U03_10535 [Staphylococcus epidermidis]|nr:hypothetical protein [Staphylococcus epidermidis]
MELDDNKIEISLQKDDINQKIRKSEKEVQKKKLEIKNLENQFELYHKHLSELNRLSDINDYVNQKVLLELEILKVQESKELEELEVKIQELKKEILGLKKQYNYKMKEIEQRYEILKEEISLQIKAKGISNKKALNFNMLHGSGTNLNKDLLTIYLVYMNLIDFNKNFGLPFAIDSFVKNETDSSALEKMFNAVDKYFLTLNNQTFFSIIKENRGYINKSINIIKVEKPLLKKELYNCLEGELI